MLIFNAVASDVSCSIEGNFSILVVCEFIDFLAVRAELSPCAFLLAILVLSDPIIAVLVNFPAKAMQLSVLEHRDEYASVILDNTNQALVATLIVGCPIVSVEVLFLGLVLPFVV